MQVNSQRVRTLKDIEIRKGPVVYWMSREQRLRDNWALLHAQELAMENIKVPFLEFPALTPQDSEKIKTFWEDLRKTVDPGVAQDNHDD